jgi:hypothetical protein
MDASGIDGTIDAVDNPDGDSLVEDFVTEAFSKICKSGMVGIIQEIEAAEIRKAVIVG